MTRLSSLFATSKWETMNWSAMSGELFHHLTLRLTRSVAVSSLLDMEIKYNRAIEEKTLLEQEIIVKQEVEEENQRLKDECRGA